MTNTAEVSLFSDDISYKRLYSEDGLGYVCVR